MKINQTIKARWHGGTRNGTDILYLVVHYTGNGGQTATAKGNASYFAATERKASAHYVVDEGDSIYQCVPDHVTAYAVGDGGKGTMKGVITNGNSISIEMVSHSDTGGYYIPEETLARTAELLRALRKKYPGIQGIYRHYDVTGKKCPAPLVAKEAWERFLDRVKEDAEMKLYKHTTQMPDWAAASVRKAIGKGFLTVNSKGEISVYEPNLQVIVMMDRMGLLGE